ncbi:MAG: hypothetical protein DYG89_41785 [Caldilinea sp. CFX5]|nr:hypothetical protein [Caldilinea sp. CFX5]
MRILLITVVGLLWLAGQATDNRWASAAYAQTVPPAPTPAWNIDPNQNNLALFIVDYAAEGVKEAYFLQEPPCQSALPTTTLTLNARAAISNTLTGGYLAFALQAGSRLPETTTWFDALFAWSIHLGDFTAQALLTPCLGQPIFAGESLWMGQGVRPFPRQPLPAAALTRLPTPVPPPAALATVAQTEWMTITAETAWSAIADLNLLHDLAQQPFATHAFLYRPATGYADPLEELAHAEWVFIVYRGPLNRAQIPDEYYLPLIHQ